MKIAGREIGPGHPPYIVSDISASHNGDIERGRKLIRLAKTAGADAVKFQAYLPELVSCDAKRDEFVIQNGPWKGRTLYDLYQQAYTPRAHLAEYFAYAKEVGITAFSTACAKEDIDFLEGLDNPCIKIASMDIFNIPFIEYAASKGKPLIISTGMATRAEMDEADAVLRDARAEDRVVWLHCVSNYDPCPLEESGLARMRAIDRWLCGDLGFSDHTIGHDAAIMSVALGARVIEKHLTLDRRDGGLDDHFATEPLEFLQMVEKVRSAYEAMQTKTSAGEEAHRPLRPSIRAVAAIERGELFTEQNVRVIRPGGGLHPREMSNVLGLRAAHAIEAGEAIDILSLT